MVLCFAEVGWHSDDEVMFQGLSGDTRTGHPRQAPANPHLFECPPVVVAH